MKILAFTDLHEFDEAFDLLKDQVKNADLIVCAGDMTIFEHNLEEVMKKIAGLKKEVILIHGNHEVASHVKIECEKYENVVFAHKKVIERNGVRFFCYGGGGFSEKDEGFEKFFEQNKNKLNEASILVTHAPPYGTKLDYVWEDHVGCKSIKKVLKHFVLAISGHIHENFGEQEVIGETMIMNPGPAGVIFEIN